MKITSIETIQLRYPPRSAHRDAQHHFGAPSGLAIRLHTDGGITGHSACHFGVDTGGAEAIKAMIDRNLAAALVGQDPFLPRLQRDRLWHAVEYSGVEGIAHFALTALDTGLWDIMARTLNVPGWKLLGACRERIPAYAMVGWYYDDDDDLEVYRRVIATAMEDGMLGVKIKVAGGSLEDDVHRIEVARSLVGPSTPLMVDANQVLSRMEALRRGQIYQQLKVYWYEEPMRPHDKEGYGWLCDCLDVPIACGENEYGKYHVQELIDAGGCDILQPDIRRTGGPSEWMEIAGLAAAHHVPIASHGGSGATSHLLMATPSAFWCETGGKPKGPGQYVDSAPIENGYVYAPEAPGFGTELREEIIERYGVR